MDPWMISSQPSLSLDLHVGLPSTMGHHHRRQAAPVVALAKPKVLVEENFLPLKKDPEVAVLEAELQRVSEENRRLGEMLREVAGKYEALQGQFSDMVTSANGGGHPSSASEGGSVSPSRKRKSESPLGGGVGDDQAEPGGADGHDSDEGPQLQGGARHRALRPDLRALAGQGPKLILPTHASGIARDVHPVAQDFLPVVG